MADRDVLELANDEEFGDGGMDDMENEVPEHKLFCHEFSNMGWMTMRCLTDKFFFMPQLSGGGRGGEQVEGQGQEEEGEGLHRGQGRRQR